jgi:hypothetical protein
MAIKQISARAVSKDWMFCSMGFPQAMAAGWDRAYALALSLIKPEGTQVTCDIFSGVNDRTWAARSPKPWVQVFTKSPSNSSSVMITFIGESAIEMTKNLEKLRNRFRNISTFSILAGIKNYRFQGDSTIIIRNY